MFRLNVDKEIELLFPQASLAPELFQLVDADRERLGLWMDWVDATRSVADVEAFIERSILGFAKQESMACFIQYKGALAGVASFGTLSRSLRKVEIGYWIAAEHEGKGIVQRSCERLIEYAFHDWGMEKVELRVAPENLKSRRVCERLGCQLEGEFSHAERLGERIVGHVVYALWKNGS